MHETENMHSRVIVSKATFFICSVDFSGDIKMRDPFVPLLCSFRARVGLGRFLLPSVVELVVLFGFLFLLLTNMAI